MPSPRKSKRPGLPPILRDLAIHYDGEILPRCYILKLHHLVSLTGELSPVAGLVPVLLNRLIFASVPAETDGAQTTSDPLHGEWLRLPFEHDLLSIHELGGDGAKER
jgi:hypothetical protein